MGMATTTTLVKRLHLLVFMAATGPQMLGPFRTEWLIVQVGAGQPRPRELPRGTTLLVARAVPHDPHMTVHRLEDQPEDTSDTWWCTNAEARRGSRST